LIELVNFSDKPGRELRISVIDNGIGIREEDHSNIFKMFGSIKDKQSNLNLGGIGLGLVISKMIVERFSGKMSFFSKYRQGSTFYFSFKTLDFTQESLKLAIEQEETNKNFSS
jgi:signal transduction histidine kinase